MAIQIPLVVYYTRVGYGVWEFTFIPYGLIGSTQICQQGLDRILKDYKICVDNYNDNCIMLSDDIQSHVANLQHVLRIQSSKLSSDS